ncbi:Maf family protein [Algicola sagamiensis]|uniref:Maf family protein n=1 Tax=Algicola sagamiensis TaxID=163869 RepID=UPI00037C2C47|nr:nucleoside triphosphate pyrophosphatase [Algicola sagamiensis]
MNKTPTVILASTSPFRRALLEKLNIPFQCKSPNIDESPLPSESPQELVRRLSIDKADVIAQHTENALVIGSDQVAVYDGNILGKPGNFENAFAQLSAFRGQKVDFFTGLAVIDTKHHTLRDGIAHYSVYFKDLTDTQIQTYLEQETPYQCAGSFKSEGLGICLFQKMEGSDPNSLIGLPLIKLTQYFEELGYDIFSMMNR